jgi:hypothetical protein
VYYPLGGGSQNVGCGWLNLDDFGVAAGASIDTVTLTGTAGSHPDLIALGALNVPEPATLSLLTLGGLALLKRKRG